MHGLGLEEVFFCSFKLAESHTGDAYWAAQETLISKEFLSVLRGPTQSPHSYSNTKSHVLFASTHHERHSFSKEK